ncbi:MAG TPA: hypothetical protein VFE02_17885, partial [Candidatus Acidoferrales bacterium]|nr:hypothetical protein [Candidatus Acidoferrales bacterium]
CRMTDDRGNPCPRPASRAFTLRVQADTKEKELVFWCCDFHYAAFKEKFPDGQLKKVPLDFEGFLVGEE